MKKKLISVLLIASMAMTLVAGCGGKKDEPKKDDAPEKEKITFMVPDWGVPTDEQLAAFTE